MSNKTLYGMAFAVGTLLGIVTLVTKSGIGIVILTLWFIGMSCAEIYWYSIYQDAAEELKRFKYNYIQAAIETQVKLELLEKIGKMDADEANEMIKAFLEGRR